jgi:hypothetical protein
MIETSSVTAAMAKATWLEIAKVAEDQMTEVEQAAQEDGTMIQQASKTETIEKEEGEIGDAEVALGQMTGKIAAPAETE